MVGFTLIEFKGPTDALKAGDLARLAGCAFLWHGQQEEGVPQAEITLIVLAPSVNEAARQELHLLGWQVREQESGVHRVAGGPFALWLIETDVMAELGQPVLALVSRVFLHERGRIIGELKRTGHRTLLNYVVQQIEQFRGQGEEFAMQHADTERLSKVEEDMIVALFEQLPPERIPIERIPIERLPIEKIPPEDWPVERLPIERLPIERLPIEKRLQGLSPEDLADALSDEQARRLRELLERREGK